MPIIRELFEKLAGHKIFSKLDLKESFLQLPLNPLHRHKTAFSWKGQLYQFAGTPFGLKHITYVFQKIMNSLLKDMPFALAYVDDIIIFSNSIHEHQDHVIAVVDRLISVNLRLKTAKCVFFQKKIKLLGHSISSVGMEIDEEKMDAALNWEQPCTGKQMQQFLGLTNYFREFIPNYSAVTAPLDKLRNLKRLTADDWSQETTQSFELLKRIITKTPILSYPDYSVPFSVATDASNCGIGAMLFQETKEKRKYILFAARSLSESERRYSTPKKELLAIIYAFKKFHPYIWGTRFTLYTDNQPLTFIKTQKILTNMAFSWLETILAYDFAIIHVSC